MMKFSLKKAVVALLAAGGVLCMGAREASTFFVQAPPRVISIFDRNSRLDMLDYYRSKLTTPTGNVLRGKSRVTAESPDLVTVNISDNTRLDLALLRVKGDTVIAIIETVNTPIPDSSIRFYRKDWSELPTPTMPTGIDFVAKKNRKSVSDSLSPIDFISAEYLPEKGLFKFTNHTSQYYVKEEVPQGVAIADTVLTMRFDGKKFVPVK